MPAPVSVPTTAPPARPRPADVLVVAVGGTVGTAARAAAVLLVPTAEGAVPWTVGVVNVGGALLLGLLLGVLGGRPDTGGRRRARLLLGTGVLGGFTTYSALAVDAAGLLGDRSATGAAYAVGSLLLGLVAAAVGLLLGGRRARAARRGLA
ncbi:CrcB family protein [Nocardioides sp. ChNu-99]|uniref:CrcB family protein n=1 Tax=Nocardioides sp. ChNu-99 TaxID=2839897 RepID=UPI002406C991|nr:CrcB family protein [Nocardioides sp. ChNu-99]MDF9716124.1 CrcB family protein [Nocardioides sp. ChNu-99]